MVSAVTAQEVMILSKASCQHFHACLPAKLQHLLTVPHFTHQPHHLFPREHPGSCLSTWSFTAQTVQTPMVRRASNTSEPSALPCTRETWI